MAAEYSVDGLDRWEKAAGLIGGAAGAEQDVANERGYPRHIAVTKSLIFTLDARQFRLYCKYRKSNSRNLDTVPSHTTKISRRRYLHGRPPHTATLLARTASCRRDARRVARRRDVSPSAILSVVFRLLFRTSDGRNVWPYGRAKLPLLYLPFSRTYRPTRFGRAHQYTETSRRVAKLFYYSSLMRHVMREPITR